MLKILSDEFGCAEIKHVSCAEYRFLIAGPERIEPLEPSYQLRRDIGKCDIGIYIKLWAELVGLDMFGHIFLSIITTRMACHEPENETRFIVALEEASTAKALSKTKVILVNSNGDAVLTLERQNI